MESSPQNFPLGPVFLKAFWYSSPMEITFSDFEATAEDIGIRLDKDNRVLVSRDLAPLIQQTQARTVEEILSLIVSSPLNVSALLKITSEQVDSGMDNLREVLSGVIDDFYSLIPCA